MSSSNSLSDLISELSRSNAGDLAFSQFLQPLTSSTSSSGSVSVQSSSLGLKSIPVGGSEKVQSIQFGKPSDNRTPTSSSGSGMLSSLLSQAGSGGLSSALSGGLGSIAGIGGLFSDIRSLFGGSKSTPPPLVLFSLPNSVQQTAYISSSGASVYAGDAVEQSTQTSTGSGVYTSGTVVNKTGTNAVSSTTDSTAIAQAVKNALLSSNSLGDVIAEL